MSTVLKYDRLDFGEVASVGSVNPSNLALYAKTDNYLYTKDSTGTERQVTFAVGSGLELWNGNIQVTSDIARYSFAGTFLQTNTFSATQRITGAGNGLRLDELFAVPSTPAASTRTVFMSPSGLRSIDPTGTAYTYARDEYSNEFTAAQRIWASSNPTPQLHLGIAGNTGGQIFGLINGNTVSVTLSGAGKSIIFDGTAATTDIIQLRHFGLARWLVRNNFDAAVDTNDGTNTGANMCFMSRNDNGTQLDNPFLGLYRGARNFSFRTTTSGTDGSGIIAIGNMVRLPTGSPASAVLIMSSGGSFMYRNTNGNQRYVVGVESITKTTAGAPFTNDGYITLYIGNNTAIKVMTTA